MHKTPPVAPTRPRTARLLAASGAVLLAGGVTLAAYAAHAGQGDAQPRLQMAAAFAFGHGLALAALAPHARARLSVLVLATLLTGTLLFCGGLVAGTLFGIDAPTAPIGGALMIVGWLAWAALALRDQP